MALRKMAISCIECGGIEVAKLNVTAIWDFQVQHWVDNELSHPSQVYRCRDCHAESKEVYVAYRYEGVDYNNA